MNAEAAVYTVLSGVAGCTFYPVQYPDPDGAIPPIFGTFTRIGGVSYNTLEGDTSTSNTRMQISIFATSFADLKTVESAVAAAMKTASASNNPCNYSGAVPVSGFEQETRRYYAHMDYNVWTTT